MDARALTTFFAQTPLYYLATDATGQIIATNATTARMLGCAVDEVPDRPLHTAVTLPDPARRPDRSRTDAPAAPVPHADAAPTMALAHWCLGGDAPTPFPTLVTPIVDADGHLAGALILGVPPTLPADAPAALPVHAIVLEPRAIGV